MARFLLTGKQYMNVGEEWEQVETAPNGKQVRHRYRVHTHLDPDDPSAWNSPEGIVVSTKEDPLFPRDLIFTGSPNEDMHPLDKEASMLLASLPKGVNPVSEQAFPTLTPQPSQPDPLAAIKAQLAELAGAVALLNGENAELKQQLREREVEDEPLLPPSVVEVKAPALL